MAYFARAPKKSWHFSMLQSESLAFLLESFLTPLGHGALVLPEGKTLHLRTNRAQDIATLPQAALLCHQYLNLRDGDVAIVNDPYSVGTLLSDLTLVVGVRFEENPGVDEIDLLLAQRISFPPRLPQSLALDSEGVRIPPTPVGRIDNLNSDLLNAIGAHPLAPENFVETVNEAGLKIEAVRQKLKIAGTDPGSELKKIDFKRYLADSARAFRNMLGRLPLGTVLHSTRLQPGGELLKLKLDVTETFLNFDFAGSDSSDSIHLTDLITFGACVAATLETFHLNLPLNSGTLEHFQVSTPAKTLLSGRAPTGVFRGMQSGLGSVCNLVVHSFAKLNPSLRSAKGVGCRGYFEIEFENGQRLADSVAPGEGAQPNESGAHAHALWHPQDANSLSVEELEKKYPLVVTQAGLRSNSGGKGSHLGGDGAVKAYRVKSNAKARWIFGPLMAKQEGLASGRSGLSGEIRIVRSSSQHVDEFTTPEGEVLLEPGDEIRFLAPGGGGFGPPPEA